MIRLHSVPETPEMLLKINEAISKERDAGCIVDFCGEIKEAWNLFELIRHSGMFCCLEILSDYYYTYGIKLTEMYVRPGQENIRDEKAASLHKPTFVLDVPDVEIPILIAVTYCWVFDIKVEGLQFDEYECDPVGNIE